MIYCLDTNICQKVCVNLNNYCGFCEAVERAKMSDLKLEQKIMQERMAAVHGVI